MAASSIRNAPNLQNQASLERPQLLVGTSPITPHDIFLSHSGAQKGFVRGLYEELSDLGFNSFFDITHHSLPLAESFPSHIFRAAKKCKLAVVVLSEEFLSSKWPMMELSAFVEAMSTGVKILPLFYKISPADLKKKSNLKKWSKAWKAISKHSKRIDLDKWANAINTLCSQNGLNFNAQDGERAYLRQIIAGICEIVPLAIKFDARFTPGMTRICQVILDKFQKMEIPEQYPSSKVSVLGLYGLPGSGKSTLCKRLYTDFFRIYAGKAFHLELPSKPSSSELVHEFKKLLRLTDFRDRFALDRVSNVEEMFNLLETYQLSRCRVFLAIDNISDQTWEVVQMFLRLGVGPGSKMVLVARTLDILQPAFLLLKQHGQHYICDNTCIPSIDEAEAIQILLQTSSVGTCRDSDGQALQQSFPPGKREMIISIVRMCSSGSKDHPLYLPLIMKTMGAMLIKYKGDWEQWGNDLGNFWASVVTYKEKAVQELVGKSFAALPEEQLQLLFLDLALFILPLKFHKLNDIYTLIGSIYDGISAANIQTMIKDLERHCFLTVIKSEDNKVHDYIKVHDVYLEFAESIGEDASRHIEGLNTRLCWKNWKAEGKVCILMGAACHHPVRAMILEVGDGCERVDLQGFSSLKALAVRNGKSVTVLGLAGLSSLASLDIQNCSNLRHIEWSDDSNLCKIKRLNIFCSKDGQTRDVRSTLSFLDAVREWGLETLDLPPFFKWLQWPVVAAPRQSSIDMGTLRKMRGLQVLHLEKAGIRRLVDMSTCWPQLRDLIVKECYLEKLEVGNLPNLKRFLFSDCITDHGRVWPEDQYRLEESWKSKNDNPRFLLQGKGLLEGCPQLEEVAIRSAFFEQGELGKLPPNLRSLELRSFYPAKRLPDVLSSAHTLEVVDLQWCENLEKVNFNVEFGRLRTLKVGYCRSLMEVTGLGFLSSLCLLEIFRCPKLQAVLGFDSLRLLESFNVRECPDVRRISSLNGLTSLEILWLDLSPRSADLAVTEPLLLEDGLGNLKKLKDLRLKGSDERGFAGQQEKITCCRRKALNLSFSSLVGQTVHSETVPATTSLFSRCSSFHSLQSIELCYLTDMESVAGIEHLQLTLESLDLVGLEKLRSLRGLESLINLQRLHLGGCVLLEEIPSMHMLVNMQDIFIHECPKLKAVEGCDVALVSGSLEFTEFCGCQSLERLPLSETALREFERRTNSMIRIKFKDCKFARTDEIIMAWAMNEDLSSSIRTGSLSYLHEKCGEYDASERTRLFDGMFPFLLNRLLPNDDDCLNFHSLATHILSLHEKRHLLWDRKSPQLAFPNAIVIELQQKLGGLPKKALLEQIQADIECKLSILCLLDKVGFHQTDLEGWFSFLINTGPRPSPMM